LPEDIKSGLKNWNKEGFNDSNREDFLKELEKFVASEQGRPPVEVKIESMGEKFSDTVAGFDREKNIMIFNADKLDANPGVILGTLLHEGEHAKQRFAYKNDNKYPSGEKIYEDKYFDKLRTNQENYCEGAVDFALYAYQFKEREARAVSNNMMKKYSSDLPREAYDAYRKDFWEQEGKYRQAINDSPAMGYLKMFSNIVARNYDKIDEYIKNEFKGRSEQSNQDNTNDQFRQLSQKADQIKNSEWLNMSEPLAMDNQQQNIRALLDVFSANRLSNGQVANQSQENVNVRGRGLA
jgi:hypothetical protein